MPHKNVIYFDIKLFRLWMEFDYYTQDITKEDNVAA